MQYVKVKQIIALVLLFAIAQLAVASVPQNAFGDSNHMPDLPSPVCDTVQVPPGNKVASHAYAVGVQIYRWNGTMWVFVEPVAGLFADTDHHGKVGMHYAGPTWESNSGSKVVATRLAACSPDATAIPWLLLQATSTDGPGVFSSVTYVQRVNTVGGVAPAAPGSSIGALAEVPYTAEYFFYRARD